MTVRTRAEALEPYFAILSQELGQYRIQDNADYRNPAFWTDAIDAASDTTFLDAAEAKLAELLAEDQRRIEISKMEDHERFGRQVIREISTRNKENSITVQGVIDMVGNADMMAIITTLSIGAVTTAKQLITDINISSLAPLSESDRTDILAMIDAYLASLV